MIDRIGYVWRSIAAGDWSVLQDLGNFLAFVFSVGAVVLVGWIILKHLERKLWES